jgi:hypothetical protein
LAVLLRLDRQAGDEPEQEEDAGYPISVDLLYTNTYLDHRIYDDEYKDEDLDFDELETEE